MDYLGGLAPSDFDLRPGRRPFPDAGDFGQDFTIGRMYRQLIGEANQHLGQMGYVRGLRAEEALRSAGYEADAPAGPGNLAQANQAIRRGKPVATESAEIATQAEVDVVVEATGHPDAGARHADQAIASGKHVVMVNVEADVLVGPLLKQRADRAGVVYTLAYGDQPAVIKDL